MVLKGRGVQGEGFRGREIGRNGRKECKERTKIEKKKIIEIARSKLNLYTYIYNIHVFFFPPCYCYCWCCCASGDSCVVGEWCRGGHQGPRVFLWALRLRHYAHFRPETVAHRDQWEPFPRDGITGARGTGNQNHTQTHAEREKGREKNTKTHDRSLDHKRTIAPSITNTRSLPTHDCSSLHLWAIDIHICIFGTVFS